MCRAPSWIEFRSSINELRCPYSEYRTSAARDAVLCAKRFIHRDNIFAGALATVAVL
jgi:hypothetical protein